MSRFERTKLANQSTIDRLTTLFRKEFDNLQPIDFVTDTAENLIYDAYCVGLDDLVEEMITDSKSEGFNFNLENIINNGK